MAYIFDDDMSPESDEYSSNYTYFDEKKEGMMNKMMKICRQKGAKKDSDKPSFEFLCEHGCAGDWERKIKCASC